MASNTFICAVSLLVLSSCASEPKPAPEPQQPAISPIALEARSVIKRNCYKCHGQPDHPTFGEVVPLDWILDRDKLIEHRLVIPGSPKKSRLIYLIVMGDMPREMDESGSPSGRVEMPEEEVEAIIKWVKSGAPAWQNRVRKRTAGTNK